MDLALASGRGEPLLTDWPDLELPLARDADIVQVGERGAARAVVQGVLRRHPGDRDHPPGRAGRARRRASKRVPSVRSRGSPRAASIAPGCTSISTCWTQKVMPAVDSPGSPGIRLRAARRTRGPPCGQRPYRRRRLRHLRSRARPRTRTRPRPRRLHRRRHQAGAPRSWRPHETTHRGHGPVGPGALSQRVPRGEGRRTSLPPVESPATSPASDDFDFLMGEWRVRHRIMRPLQDGQWSEFEGDCSERPLMGGRGNVEEHRFERPTGVTYGVAVRAYDPRPPSGPSGGSTAACPTATWIRR